MKETFIIHPAIRRTAPALLAAAAIIFTAPLFAQLTGPGQESQPPHIPELKYEEADDLDSVYLEPFVALKSYGHEATFDDLNKTVVYVFSLDCQFSRTMHASIVNWGRTLPPDWKFVAVPVPTQSNTSAIALAGIMEKSAGGQFREDDYWQLMYSRVQDGLMSPEDPESAFEVAVEAGANAQHLSSILGGQNEVVYNTLDRGWLPVRYQVDRTPTIIVGDRWLTHPDIAGDSITNLLRVANALVSLAINEETQMSHGGHDD